MKRILWLAIFLLVCGFFLSCHSGGSKKIAKKEFRIEKTFTFDFLKNFQVAEIVDQEKELKISPYKSIEFEKGFPQLEKDGFRIKDGCLEFLQEKKKDLTFHLPESFHVETNEVGEIRVRIRVNPPKERDFYLMYGDHSRAIVSLKEVKGFNEYIIPTYNLHQWPHQKGSKVGNFRLFFPSFSRKLLVEIDYIRFIKKEALFSDSKGLTYWNVNDDIRPALYLRSGSKVKYSSQIPKNAILSFSTCALKEGQETIYTVDIESNGQEENVFYLNEKGAQVWKKHTILLKKWEGQEVKILFGIKDNGQEHQIGFYSNPFLLEKKQNGRVIFVYVIDALRPDHMSAYGYPLPTTPNIKRLAQSGILFKNAYCSYSKTRPSVSSLLTSLYPIEHGVKGLGDLLPNDAVSIADVLTNHNFFSALITSNSNAGPVTGLHRNFNICSIREEDIFKVIEDYKEEQDLFIYFHTVEPHYPYGKYEFYRQMFNSEFKQSLDHITTLDGIKNLSEDEKKEVVRLYDSDVRSADDRLGLVVDKLKMGGLLSRTFLIISADHGETFYEHEDWGHGTQVYQESILVPLVLYCQNVLPEGLSIESPVQLIDIVPTIYDLLDIPKDAFPSRGQSLLEIVNYECGEGKIKHRDIFSMSDNRRISIIDRNLKLITENFVIPREVKFELYDLENDPYEKENLALQKRDDVQRLIVKLKSWIDEYPLITSPKPRQRITTEDYERLKSLGYIK